MGSSFRLMTANLLHGKCDPSDFARVLGETEPDVVVTQELGPQCADVIAGSYPVHRLRPALDFSGRGIATRLEARFGDIDMPGRPGSVASVVVSNREVHIAGVHLLNPIHYPWWQTARGRRRQMKCVVDWVEEVGEGAIVVAGDFNASPAWPVYKSMADRLPDLVAERARREGLAAERTWAWRPGWPRLLRIDHVFGSGLVATNVLVERIAGTDHHAVVVDLKVDE